MEAFLKLSTEIKPWRISMPAEFLSALNDPNSKFIEIVRIRKDGQMVGFILPKITIEYIQSRVDRDNGENGER